MPPEQATRAWRTGSEPFPLVVHSPPCRPGPRGPYVCLPNPPAVLSRGESAGSAVSLRGPGRSQLGLSRRGPGGERPREGPAVAPSEALGVTFFQAPEPRTQADAGAGPLQGPQVLAEQLAWLGPARVWRGLSGGAAASGGVRVRCCETDPPPDGGAWCSCGRRPPVPRRPGPALPVAARGWVCSLPCRLPGRVARTPGWAWQLPACLAPAAPTPWAWPSCVSPSWAKRGHPEHPGSDPS